MQERTADFLSYIVQIDHYELLGLGLTYGKEKEDRRVLSNTNYNKAMMALQSCVVMDVKQCPKPVRLVEAYIRAADFRVPQQAA